MRTENDNIEREFKMGKKSSGSSDRKSASSKAGKRHGHVDYPALASPEKLAAQEQGEQQFVAQQALSVEREGTVIVYDKALKSFVYRTKKVTIPTEFIYDATRGRVVYSPSYKEKQNRWEEISV